MEGVGGFNGEHSENLPVWKYPTLRAYSTERYASMIVSFPYKVYSERAYYGNSLHSSCM